LVDLPVASCHIYLLYEGIRRMRQLVPTGSHGSRPPVPEKLGPHLLPGRARG